MPPFLTIALAGTTLQELRLEQPRTTLGRRPYNDIVIDNLAVSGEHAVFVRHPDGLELIDLHSTNGTYVNGRAIEAVRLSADDLIEIGRYQMRVRLDDAPRQSTMYPPSQSPEWPTTLAAALGPAPATAAAAASRTPALLRVLSSAGAGRELALEKASTRIGKPGQSVAVITRSGDQYQLAWAEGQAVQLNGQPLGAQAAPLHHQDRLGIAGVEMVFLDPP